MMFKEQEDRQVWWHVF